MDNCLNNNQDGGVEKLYFTPINTIEVKIKKPETPYWEIFGHKSEQEYFKSLNLFIFNHNGYEVFNMNGENITASHIIGSLGKTP